MSEYIPRPDQHPWEGMDANKVPGVLLQELYGPVSLLGRHLNRLIGEDDPLTEEEYEAIFVQMDEAVRHLSVIVVQLKHYVQDHGAENVTEHSA